MTASAKLNPPFRAEHVGSLLRPDALRDARTRLQGDLSIPVRESLASAELEPLEDQCIRDAVALQEEVGLQVITDGELRRRTWWQNFVSALEGTEIRLSDLHFKDASGDDLRAPTPFVHGQIKRTRGIATDEFQFVKSLTGRTPKVTIPAPTVLHFFGGRSAIDPSVYPDLDAFWADVVRAYQEEIVELAALGCTYLQIDEVHLACICDPKFQAAVRARGEDPAETVRTYAAVLNAVIDAAPDEMTIGMHFCRGNNQGHWLAEGGYDFVAETLFNDIRVDAYFMEYDSPRAGDFSPLRLLPADRVAVLGLISTKTPALETRDAVIRQVEDATRFAPIERLALSPQCGFASNYLGNPLSIDDQKRKLALVVELADEIWR